MLLVQASSVFLARQDGEILVGRGRSCMRLLSALCICELVPSDAKVGRAEACASGRCFAHLVWSVQSGSRAGRVRAGLRGTKTAEPWRH